MNANWIWIGAPHFFSVFLACLYQKYFSEKISQLFFVFTGTEEQDDKTTKTKKVSSTEKSEKPAVVKKTTKKSTAIKKDEE